MDGSGKPAGMAGAPGLSSERSIRVSVELQSLAAGQFGLRCRVFAADLALFLGARLGGDLPLLGRNLDIGAEGTQTGLRLRVRGARARLGRSVVSAGAADSRAVSDWLLGPLPLEVLDGATRNRLEGYARRDMLPMSWDGVEATLQPGLLLLSGLFGRPATLASTSMPQLRPLPPRGPATRPAVPPVPTQAEAAMSLPLLDLAQAAARLPSPAPVARAAFAAVPAPAPQVRHRPVRVRLAPGADGRIGLTLPEEAMRSLWAGRQPAAARRCLMAGFGADLMVLPEDDPIGAGMGGVPLVMQPTQAGGWYGRTARASGLVLAGDGPQSEGRGLQVERQPGRLLLRGALQHAHLPPAEVLPAPAVAAKRLPETGTLTRAKMMLCEALAMVRAAQLGGAASIELVDDAGTPLMTLPPEAAGARIRIEV